mmetsp:Transcript_14334/g.41377  ORF Transcript_14334/g.41377 Transcript_14334/m.41377 type:complete len:250 (-) Transcript_14334:101-850(-)
MVTGFSPSLPSSLSLTDTRAPVKAMISEVQAPFSPSTELTQAVGQERRMQCDRLATLRGKAAKAAESASNPTDGSMACAMPAQPPGSSQLLNSDALPTPTSSTTRVATASPAPALDEEPHWTNQGMSMNSFSMDTMVITPNLMAAQLPWIVTICSARSPTPMATSEIWTLSPVLARNSFKLAPFGPMSILAAAHGTTSLTRFVTASTSGSPPVMLPVSSTIFANAWRRDLRTGSKAGPLIASSCSRVPG